MEEPLAFDTYRIKPIDQNTKHGHITIDKDGKLTLLFNGDPFRIQIRADSSEVIDDSWRNI